MVGSIMVVSLLKYYALLHFVCYLKVAQMSINIV